MDRLYAGAKTAERLGDHAEARRKSHAGRVQASAADRGSAQQKHLRPQARSRKPRRNSGELIMGKNTGFKEYQRQAVGYQKPLLRLQHFNEFLDKPAEDT